MLYETVRYLTLGDQGLIVEFGNAISPEISAKVRGMYLAVLESGIPGITELNPTYRSLMVGYDPAVILYGELVAQLKSLEGQIGEMSLPKPNILVVPTLYGGEDYGPDMKTVMAASALSQEEIISIHTGKDYLVYMLGFTPGFSYLGGMDPRIETPRLKNPRVRIPGGSVGIAGKQTGIYSIDGPGGWQLIGRTPIKIYDPYREKPILHKAGDYIRFVSIDQAQYNRIDAQVKAGQYEYQIFPLGEE